MKKRLFPALLALVLALTMLPMGVFADDAGGGTTGTTTTTPTLPDGMTLSDDGKTLTLSKDVTLTGKTLRFYTQIPTQKPNEQDIYFEGVETLNLDTHNISGDKSVIKVHTSNLKITGTGTISNSNAGSSGDGTTIWLMDAGTLTIESGVTVETGKGEQSYAVSFNTSCTQGAALTVNGATLKSDLTESSKGSGLYVNGTLTDSVNPTITLNGAKIEAAKSGIYLAGAAKTTISNSSQITSKDVGIEIRNGELTVDNSTVTGGTGDPTSAANGNGQTSANAGIAVAQHTTVKPITVNVKGGAKVSGGAALYVTNPQQNTPTNIAQTVTVSGTGTTLTSTHTDPSTNATGNAVYAQAPVNIVIKEGAKLDGNVTMKKDDKNANKGGVDITGATVAGSITNESGDGAAVTVRKSTVSGETTGVGIIVDCTKDGEAGNGSTKIDNVNNANTSLKAEVKSSSYNTSFVGMWDVEITGLQSDKYYAIRVASKGISTTVDGNSIIIALDKPQTATYTVTCKPGQVVSVFELESKPTDWTGTIHTLTEKEYTVPAAPVTKP